MSIGATDILVIVFLQDEDLDEEQNAISEGNQRVLRKRDRIPSKFKT
jgi:hypothetical protein